MQFGVGQQQQRRLPPQQLASQVELSISCERLVNKDFLSKSDPVCVVKTVIGDVWREIGITEMIKDDLNPVFNKTITLEYRFEEQQYLSFELWDIDQPVFRGRINPRVDDTLGTMKCTLGEIVGARAQTIKKPLTLPGRRNAGFCIIRAEELGNRRNDTIDIRFRGIRLKKMDFFGKSDPYFIISKKRQDGTWQQTYKSEVIKFTLNPNWQNARLSLQKLGGSYDAPCKFDCYDWNRLTAPDFIGTFYFTIDELRQKSQFELKYAKKPKSRRGSITQEMRITPNYTFFEFLTGGLEVSLSVAIDFTGSNGNPRQPGTLHYHRPGVMNEYEAAIRAIGDILTPYDSDNRYPLYGFGARMPNGQVSHCFALNGNAQNPEVMGVDGILAAYHQALENVQLYGPTYFSEVINVTAGMAASCGTCQDLQQFHILLIITDGIINDFGKTVDAIVKASFHPMSVIIVGVGAADFGPMDQLDCDDGLLRSASGQVARDDIVQFVPFRQFRHNYQLLAKETLFEVPGQVTRYFRHRRIKPNPRPETRFESDAADAGWGALRGGLASLISPAAAPPSNPMIPMPGPPGGGPPAPGGGGGANIPTGWNALRQHHGMGQMTAPPAYPGPPQGGAPPGYPGGAAGGAPPGYPGGGGAPPPMVPGGPPPTAPPTDSDGAVEYGI